MPRLKEPIELGTNYDGYKGNGLSAAVPDSNPGLSLTLPDISALGNLPVSGEITFHYCRRNLNLSTDVEGESDLSAQITLCKILAIKADPDAVEEKGADPVDKLFAEAQASEARGDDKEVETGEGQPV